MTYPIPEPSPCTAPGSSTITLTLGNCEEHWWILIGHLYLLTDPNSFDQGTDQEAAAQVFQDMIDLAIYGGSP